MRTIYFLALMIGFFVFSGCGADVEVDTPGVDVKVNKEEGVRVKTDTVDVKVNKEKGIDVQAPGADVKVKPIDDE